jgi:hypothetical protein
VLIDHAMHIAHRDTRDNGGFGGHQGIDVGVHIDLRL